MKPKTNNKEAILDAAELVVMEMGAAHMSLNLVAKRANVSKGGLMYHFHTKNALLKAMIERLVGQFYADRTKYEAQLKLTPARTLKAAILATHDCSVKRDRMGLSILAAAAQDPELVEPIQKAHKEHLKELLASGLPWEKASIISLASDGLMFLGLLNLSPYNAKQREKIQHEMLQQLDLLGTGNK